MTDWVTGSLADFCLSIDDGDWIETKDQGGDDYRLLQVSNIGLGSFRETGKFRYVTQETFERLRCQEIRPGHVLVARMPDPVGRAWFVDRLEHPAITAVDIAILKPNPEVLHPHFCAYLLNSPRHLSESEATAGGTTRLRITRKQLAARSVQLPDLETQGQIVHVLGSFDDLIGNNQRRIEVLEEVAQAIYREWFANFRFPGHEDATFLDSALGPIPEGWVVSTCGEELRVLGGGTPSKGEPSYWTDATIPWYTPTDLTKAPARFAAPPELYISEVGLNKSSAKLFPEGSVMMTSRATLGVLSIARTDATTNQGFIVIPPDDRWPPSFIYEWLSHNAERLESVATGATFKEITKGAFKKIPFLVPAVETLEAFRSSVEPIDHQIKVLLRESEVLARLRDLLLPKLVTGEIDVSNLDLDALVQAAS